MASGRNGDRRRPRILAKRRPSDEVMALDTGTPCNAASDSLATGNLMTPAILCKQLVKRYPGKPPAEAVRGLDLEVAPGECFGLLGPNGAGKTTTLEIIEGLLDATSGEVQVLGYCWGRDDDQIRQRIGISLQETRLADKLTVRETIDLFRSFYRTGIEP